MEDQRFAGCERFCYVGRQEDCFGQYTDKGANWNWRDWSWDKRKLSKTAIETEVITACFCHSNQTIIVQCSSKAITITSYKHPPKQSILTAKRANHPNKQVNPLRNRTFASQKPQMDFTDCNPDPRNPSSCLLVHALPWQAKRGFLVKSQQKTW